MSNPARGAGALRVVLSLIVAAVLAVPLGCATRPVPVDDSKTDFKNELDMFKDLCAAAMGAGRRAGMIDAADGVGYRAAEFAFEWNRRNAVNVTPLSTANKRSVADCGLRGYEIGYGEEDQER